MVCICEIEVDQRIPAPSACRVRFRGIWRFGCWTNRKLSKRARRLPDMKMCCRRSSDVVFRKRLRAGPPLELRPAFETCGISQTADSTRYLIRTRLPEYPVFTECFSGLCMFHLWPRVSKGNNKVRHTHADARNWHDDRPHIRWTAISYQSPPPIALSQFPLSMQGQIVHETSGSREWLPSWTLSRSLIVGSDARLPAVFVHIPPPPTNCGAQ